MAEKLNSNWLLGTADCNKKVLFFFGRILKEKGRCFKKCGSFSSFNLKKMCSGSIHLNSEMSPLETLPQEILLKVLCSVDHEDLEQLFHVSKTISEATLLVKELHFRFSTPKKNTIVFHDPIDLEDANEFREIEAPKAPLRKLKSSLNRRNMSDISVALFASMDEKTTNGN